MFQDRKGLQTDELSKLRDSERLRVRREAAIELEWWRDYIIDDCVDAVRSKVLVRVPNEGIGFRLTSCLRDGREPYWLRQDALDILTVVGQRFYNDLRNNHLPVDVLLSISSLYRSAELQRELIESGANAAEISSHQAGVAFDISPNGYYKGIGKTSTTRGMESFDDENFVRLDHLLEGMENNGFCHVIREYGFREDGDQISQYMSCYHVCAVPREW